jgi:outer membrane lipoprotein
MKLSLLWVLSLLLLAGCTHVFTEQARKKVDPAVTFEALKNNPEPFVGKYIALGGTIVETRHTPEGSQIEVAQLPLGKSEVPDYSYASGGRFIAVSANKFDRGTYRPGRRVSLIGEVRGGKTVTMDGVKSVFPVVNVLEIKVWNEIDQRPYPSPFYYDPFFYPYSWYGPYGYPYRRHFRLR